MFCVVYGMLSPPIGYMILWGFYAESTIKHIYQQMFTRVEGVYT